MRVHFGGVTGHNRFSEVGEPPWVPSALPSLTRFFVLPESASAQYRFANTI
jgi:hypothetical protein